MAVVRGSRARRAAGPGGRRRFLPQLDRVRRHRAGRRRRPVGQPDRRRTQVVVLPGLRRRPCSAGADRKLGRCPTCPSDIDEELYERLREWRPRVAAAQKVPAYVVFTDATLVALAERRPSRPEELIAIAGIGPRKLGLYGEAVLALVARREPWTRSARRKLSKTSP